jgi:hypothetical protein
MGAQRRWRQSAGRANLHWQQGPDRVVPDDRDRGRQLRHPCSLMILYHMSRSVYFLYNYGPSPNHCEGNQSYDHSISHHRMLFGSRIFGHITIVILRNIVRPGTCLFTDLSGDQSQARSISSRWICVGVRGYGMGPDPVIRAGRLVADFLIRARDVQLLSFRPHGSPWWDSLRFLLLRNVRHTLDVLSWPVRESRHGNGQLYRSLSWRLSNIPGFWR